MRYMMFIKHTEDYQNKTVPPGLYAAMGEFVGEAIKSGVMIDGAGLKPPVDGTQVKLRRGKVSVVDGPFSESKEIVGGYALVELKSKKEAIELARKFMELHRIHWPDFDGMAEVRPLEDMK